MNKTFAILLSMGILACNQNAHPPQPYVFDKASLDEKVKSGKAIFDHDSLSRQSKYFLGDTAAYIVYYSSDGKIKMVDKKDEHGQVIWTESYYPNGQRQSHYPRKTFEDLGLQSLFHGYYEEFYDNGNIKEIGSYEKSLQKWSLKFTLDGVVGDTTIYQMESEKPESKAGSAPGSK